MSSAMLSGRHALVTGSVAGLGYAMARGLALQGASITLNGLAEPGVGEAAAATLADETGAEVGFDGADLAQPDEIERLMADPEGGIIELGGGLDAVCEAGTVRFTSARDAQGPAPVRLTIPGNARYGDWEISARIVGEGTEPGGPEHATLDVTELGSEVEIRAWREGDRIRPLGLNGSKTLQDLFTDSGVPRSLRKQLPVLVAGERIAWVAGSPAEGSATRPIHNTLSARSSPPGRSRRRSSS